MCVSSPLPVQAEILSILFTILYPATDTSVLNKYLLNKRTNMQ